MSAKTVQNVAMVVHRVFKDAVRGTVALIGRGRGSALLASGVPSDRCGELVEGGRES